MKEDFFKFNSEDLVDDLLREKFAFPATGEAIDKIADDNSLLDEERIVLFEIVKDIFIGKLEDIDVAPELFERLGLGLDIGLEVQDQVDEQIFDGIEDELENQRQTYIDFHPEEFLGPSPEQTDVDEELALEAIQKSGPVPENEQIERRLLKIAISHIKDIRDDEETKHALQKPYKTGGLGLAPEQATKLMGFINEAVAKKEGRLKELKEEKKIWEEKMFEAKRVKEERLKKMEQPASPEPPSEPAKTTQEDIMLADEDEDEKEIEEIKEKAAVSAIPAPLPDDFLDKQINQAISDSKLELENNDMKARYRNLVVAYFHDLRDVFETKEKLLLSIENGGLGLNPDEANRVVGILESKVNTYQATIAERTAKEKTEFVAKRQEKIMNEDIVRERVEADERDELFNRVTGKRATSIPSDDTEGVGKIVQSGHLPAPKPIPPSKPKVIPVIGISTKKEDESAKEAEMVKDPKVVAEAIIASKTPPVPPPPAPPVVHSNKPAQPSRAAAKGAPPIGLPSISDIKPGPSMLPTPDDCDVEEQKDKPSENLDPLGLDDLEDKPAKPAYAPSVPVAPKPAPAVKPIPPPVSAPVSQSEEKKVVSDVKFTPKLTGPVEELRTISLADFRRLSKEPAEATLKIKDKIDLLEDQSFEVKAEGVKAWQASETNKLYLELLRASLEGRPVTEVIAEREAASKPALSKAEFDAVMELNRNLRFG